MTSYEELLSIMEDLSGISLNVQYDGAFNGGINGRMNTKADLVKQNGSREGLDELTAKAEEKGVPRILAWPCQRFMKAAMDS